LSTVILTEHKSGPPNTWRLHRMGTRDRCLVRSGAPAK
jgi:hypothetical protein